MFFPYGPLVRSARRADRVGGVRIVDMGGQRKAMAMAMMEIEKGEI
jgi:hypothetical protein